MMRWSVRETALTEVCTDDAVEQLESPRDGADRSVRTTVPAESVREMVLTEAREGANDGGADLCWF